MKRSLPAKTSLLLLACTLLAASCSAPKVTVTSEVTVTLMPSLTPQTLTPTPEASAIDRDLPVLSQELSAWPTWAQEMVKTQGYEKAVIQMAEAMFKEAGLTPKADQERFVAIMRLYKDNGYNLGHIPEKWKVAVLNDTANYMKIFGPSTTVGRPYSEGWDLGHGETDAMRAIFAAEVNTDFISDAGYPLVIHRFFSDHYVRGRGIFGILSSDSRNLTHVDLVVDMNNNGKLNYAIVRINFNDHTLTAKDICIPAFTNRTVKSCGTGDKISGEYDAQSNMPIAPATELRVWGETIGEVVTLEQIQAFLAAGDFLSR